MLGVSGPLAWRCPSSSGRIQNLEKDLGPCAAVAVGGKRVHGRCHTGDGVAARSGYLAASCQPDVTDVGFVENAENVVFVSHL